MIRETVDGVVAKNEWPFGFYAAVGLVAGTVGAVGEAAALPATGVGTAVIVTAVTATTVYFARNGRAASPAPPVETAHHPEPKSRAAGAGAD